DAVHCEWSVITVTDPERYDALSYVWGDMNVREHDLVCNGVVIKITRNLWTALRAVWAKSPGRRLWVDAICINQDDIPERNQQVNMMGDIYRRAERVIVWLGEATELTNGLCRVMEVVEAGGKLSRAALDGPEIARRTWSRRAWTLQEIMLASHAVV
ncbi:heterokaryon incompatibility, partial [Lasiosphaeris hirsuta]